jgi:hypothetical protein
VQTQNKNRCKKEDGTAHKGAQTNAVIKFLSDLTNHTGATCNRPVELLEIKVQRLIGTKSARSRICGVLGRLHSDEGLAQTNNNAELNKSAKPVTYTADHKCGEEIKWENKRKKVAQRKRHAASPRRFVAGIAEPIVPLSLVFCFFLSVFFLLLRFLVLAVFSCFALFFFEPHAGGNDRGNTAGGGAVAGSVTSLAPRGCSDRALYTSQPTPGANGRCAARSSASTRLASWDLRRKSGKGKTKRRRKKR